MAAAEDRSSLRRRLDHANKTTRRKQQAATTMPMMVPSESRAASGGLLLLLFPGEVVVTFGIVVGFGAGRSPMVDRMGPIRFRTSYEVFVSRACCMH